MDIVAIRSFLKGVDVRLQKTGGENSGIPVHEWRIKYQHDVSKLKGIIEGIIAEIEENKKERPLKRAEK